MTVTYTNTLLFSSKFVTVVFSQNQGFHQASFSDFARLSIFIAYNGLNFTNCVCGPAN